MTPADRKPGFVPRNGVRIGMKVNEYNTANKQARTHTPYYINKMMRHAAADLAKALDNDEDATNTGTVPSTTNIAVYIGRLVAYQTLMVGAQQSQGGYNTEKMPEYWQCMDSLDDTFYKTLEDVETIVDEKIREADWKKDLAKAGAQG